MTDPKLDGFALVADLWSFSSDNVLREDPGKQKPAFGFGLCLPAKVLGGCYEHCPFGVPL